MISRPRTSRSRLLILLLAALFAVQRAAGQAELPPLQEVHRIVMLGDSITHSGEYVDFLDAYLVTRLPERPIEVLNLGIPS